MAQSLKTKAFKLKTFAWGGPLPPSPSNHSFEFNNVSRFFVEKELKLLKRKKAAGCDNLPPGILKDAAYPLSKPLTHLINLSLSTDLVPN